MQYDITHWYHCHRHHITPYWWLISMGTIIASSIIVNALLVFPVKWAVYNLVMCIAPGSAVKSFHRKGDISGKEKNTTHNVQNIMAIICCWLLVIFTLVSIAMKWCCKMFRQFYCCNTPVAHSLTHICSMNLVDKISCHSTITQTYYYDVIIDY